MRFSLLLFISSVGSNVLFIGRFQSLSVVGSGGRLVVTVHVITIDMLPWDVHTSIQMATFQFVALAAIVVIMI